VPLTPQKTEELKKELRSKFQGKEIDPEHIDELVSKLVKIARHEHSKGHTAEEIAGQHRDLYAPVKEIMVTSHQDDDGEGESRAPAMTTP
jgi:predicted transcriptional regulator